MEVEQVDHSETLSPDMLVDQPELAKQLLSNERFITKIPLINTWKSFGQLHEMQLVRFRGLVQNMLDPEIYLEAYQVKNGDVVEMRNGMYRDNINLQPNEEIIYDSQENVHGERRPMFMVSIPGMNDWATQSETDDTQCNGTSEKPSAIKRPFDVNSAATDPIPNKRINCDTESDKMDQSISKDHVPDVLNSPIAERPGNTCLVKFYDDAKTVSLNSVFEVIGFISLDASLCGTAQQIEDFESADEIRSMNPPPSLIPRIHVISYQSVNHLNPLLYGERTATRWALDQSNLDCFRLLRTAFTQCLFGDEIAADYLLCHLISTVYVRNEETLGQFSVNLTNYPQIDLSSYIKSLYEIIECCLPASHYFPITVDNLNQTNFIPTKDYSTGLLNSGLLQLAPHTHLILDETRLEPGKLESKGIEAVHHIANLIRKQQITVDFKFYQINYDANIPILLFSEGKSMFPSNCHIPLKPDNDSIQHIQETFVAIKQFLKPKLNGIRCFLTEMRLKEFDMNPANMQMIQNYFVEMRRTHNASADGLHSMLVLSRLIGILQGKNTLDEESWNRAKAMEEERRARLSNLPTSKK